MPARHASLHVVLTGLSALLALGCHSKGSLRVATLDAAHAGDSSVGEAGVGQGGNGGHDGSDSDDAGATAEHEAGWASETSTETGGSDSLGGLGAAVDANNDHAGSSDSPVDAGDPIDGGLDGGGMVQCSFPGVSQDLACAPGEYCKSFVGGAISDSGTSYSCSPFPVACLADRSCACLCGSASGYSASQCAVYGSHCLCIVNQGSLVLLCSGA